MTSVKSGFFSLSNKFFGLWVNLGSLAILGRLLTPEDFGLFGIIIATETLFLPLLDMGLMPAFIKLEKVTPEASNTFFTINILLGGMIGILMFITAPILVNFYGQKELLFYTWVFAISIILTSLSHQPIAFLARAKKFHKILLIDQVALFCGACAAIYSARLGLGAWALIIRAIVFSTARSLCSHVITKQKYKIVNAATIMNYRPSIRFGGEIVLSRLIGGLNNSIDKFLFGRLFSISLLGHYTRAFHFAKMPDSNIRTSLTTPALAHIARINKLKRFDSYILMCNIVILLAGVPCIIFFVLGNRILPWLMGSQWHEAGIFLQFLGIWGLGKIIHGLCVIIYINEQRLERWIKISIFSFPAIYIIPILSYLIFKEARFFVLSLSICNLLFWNIVLAQFIKNESNEWKSSIKMLQTQVCMLVAGGLLLFGKIIFLDPINYITKIETINLAATITVIILSVMLFQFLWNFSQVKSIYNYFNTKYIKGRI